MSHAAHYQPRTLVCETCGAEYRRNVNRAGSCGPCQYARMRQWAKESGALAASNLVNYSVKTGRLPSPKGLACVDCGGAANRYDHRDYNRPLDVEPVCASCNNLRGPALHVSQSDEQASRTQTPG